jgi:Rrf2 family protein
MVGPSQFWLGARADYAIRALAELAIADSPRTATQIAAARSIPKTFLTVILSELVRGGLVRSRRGRIGGYVLARQPGDICISDVVTAVGDHRAHPPAEVTSGEDEYQRLRGRLYGLIDDVSLADLLATNIDPGPPVK